MLTMEHSKEGLHFLSHELASKTDEFSEIVESEQGAHITCTYMYCLFSVLYSFQLENKKTKLFVHVHAQEGTCIFMYLN